eukprot:5034205-Prorocentrum_lima.AAC.1
MAPRTFELTGSTEVRTPPQSLRWRAKVVVQAKLMGPFVYVLPRTPEALAAAGGERRDSVDSQAYPHEWPRWDTPSKALRAYELD